MKLYPQTNMQIKNYPINTSSTHKEDCHLSGFFIYGVNVFILLGHTDTLLGDLYWSHIQGLKILQLLDP